LHLGYRKGKSGGVWVARFYGGGGAYVVETFAEADDLAEANGVDVLNYRQAQDRARELAQNREERADGPPLTVRRLIAEYGARREERRITFKLAGSKHDAFNRLSKLPEALLDTPAARLTVDQLATAAIGERTRHDC
jgi:hypothetical protein